MKKSEEMRVVADVIGDLELSCDYAYAQMREYQSRALENEENGMDATYENQQAEQYKYRVEIYTKLMEAVTKITK